MKDLIRTEIYDNSYFSELFLFLNIPYFYWVYIYIIKYPVCQALILIFHYGSDIRNGKERHSVLVGTDWY